MEWKVGTAGLQRTQEGGQQGRPSQAMAEWAASAKLGTRKRGGGRAAWSLFSERRSTRTCTQGRGGRERWDLDAVSAGGHLETSCGVCSKAPFPFVLPGQ